MAETTYFTSADPVTLLSSGAPRIVGTAVAFPPNRYDQEDVARELTSFAEPGFMRFAGTTGVEHRSLALPLSRYPKLTGFTEANTAYIEVGVDIGERAVLSALDAAGIAPEEVDIIVAVSSTGVAVPSIDARLAPAIGLRPDVKRVPLFGLGCLAGTAGMARVNDYLRAFPGQVAVLLSVELCSLTLQRDDTSIPALIGGMPVRRRCGRGGRHRGRPRCGRAPARIGSSHPGIAEPAASGNRRHDGLGRGLQRARTRAVQGCAENGR